MRGWMARAVAHALITLLIANSAGAAGPEFTGLLNYYAPAPNPNFSKTADFRATMDLNGPIAGTEVRLPTPPIAGGVWSDVVVRPDNADFFAFTHTDVFSVDPTGALSRFIIFGPGITDASWVVGATWDSTRNRLVVATQGGTGQILAFAGDWSVMSSLQGIDLMGIVHRPANDTIYALQNTNQAPLTELLKYTGLGHLAGSLQLSPAIPFEPGTADLDWQMMMASDGQLAVIAPARFPPGSDNAGSLLYLINPDTGEVTYGAELPVPEPHWAGLLLAAALIGRRPRAHQKIKKESVMKLRIIMVLLPAIIAASGPMAHAAGPQFEGLLPYYAPAPNPNFSKSADSVARMDLNGAVPGEEFPLARPPIAGAVWSEVVVSGFTTYAATHHEVYRIDPETRSAVLIGIEGVQITEETWIGGATWDSNRNRLLVATQGDTGYFFTYPGMLNQWDVLSNLQNTDLLAIAHRPANDLVYAIGHPHDTALTHLLTYTPNGQPLGGLLLSPAIPFETGTADLDWQMMMASDGQLAVIAPARFPRGSDNVGSLLYLINPDTGEVTYGAELPVPEPRWAGLMLALTALSGRRTRVR